jgi:hypothetical protein
MEGRGLGKVKGCYCESVLGNATLVLFLLRSGCMVVFLSNFIYLVRFGPRPGASVFSHLWISLPLGPAPRFFHRLPLCSVVGVLRLWCSLVGVSLLVLLDHC